MGRSLVKKLIIKKINGEIVCSNALLADGFFERAQGLMFSNTIPFEGDGMLIKPCNSIHTFFMNYDLHIIFMDSKNKVIKVIKNMKPWRMTRMYFTSHQVLELKTDKDVNVTVGDVLEVLCIN